MKVAEISSEELKGFRESLKGKSYVKGEDGYDAYRERLNWKFHERYPGLIVLPTSVEEVSTIVRFCRSHSIAISVMCGGHSPSPACAPIDGAVLVHMSAMKTVTVNATERTAEVGGGALLVDVDRATGEHNLAVPLGTWPKTGIGLILQGGVGVLSSEHGRACDHIIGAEIVTADGEIHRLTESETDRDLQDLFWAIKGAAPHVGIVTSLTLSLSSVPEKVVGGILLWPATALGTLLKEFTLWGANDRRMGYDLMSGTGKDGSNLVFIYFCARTTEEEFSSKLSQIEAKAGPVLNKINYGYQSYLQCQLGFMALFGEEFPLHLRHYWRSTMVSFDFVEHFDEIADFYNCRPPGFMGLIQSSALRLTDDVIQTDSVCDIKGDVVSISHFNSWANPENDDLAKEFSDNFIAKVESLKKKKFEGFSYFNETLRKRDNPRLHEIKQKWDPDALFRPL